ncbi:MAG: hypothetical protein R3E02_04235 [Blastomonas sp.]
MGAGQLPASRKLRPIQQGELDGLCGIYSLINAIRLVKFEVGAYRAIESEALFSFAVYRLSDTGDLRERICTGVPWGVLKQVGQRMAKVASEGGVALRVAPVKRGQANRIAIIKRHLLSGTPIIASVHRDHHYTVLAGWTPTRAVIFDSSGSHWVPLESIQRTLCLAVSLRSGDKMR